MLSTNVLFSEIRRLGEDNSYVDSGLHFNFVYGVKDQLQLHLKIDAGFLQNHPLHLGVCKSSMGHLSFKGNFQLL